MSISYPLTVAPDFTLQNQEGINITLSEVLTRKKVVLFFYPQASSPICTAQACNFRNLTHDFERFNTVPLGISADSIPAIRKFHEENHLGFSLLSDPLKNVAKQYHVARTGVLSRFFPVKRVSFIIDQDRKILARITGELYAKHHSIAATEFLEKNFSPTP